jgi:uncharacterized radical SAM superfamily Fe-S cluster-containing enzyme
MEADPTKAYNQNDATGFIALNALRLKVAARVHCISSRRPFYWLAQGDPQNACCGGGACSAGDGRVTGTLGRNAQEIENQGPKIEKLSTCLALIEIVNSCNLACPTCYADSPVGAGARSMPCRSRI